MKTAAKLMTASSYFITAVNAHPHIRSMGGNLQILVPILSLAVSLLMGLVLKDYDPVKQTVSQMVHYPYGWILTTDFLAVSVWLFILAAKFYFGYARRNFTKISALLLLLAAFGFFLIAVFPTNLEGTLKDPIAVAHEWTARIVSMLFPVACILLLPQLVHERGHRYLAIYTIITVVFGFGLLAVCATVVYSGGQTLGLFERLLMANAFVWGLVASIRLFPVNRSDVALQKTR